MLQFNNKLNYVLITKGHSIFEQNLFLFLKVKSIERSDLCSSYIAKADGAEPHCPQCQPRDDVCIYLYPLPNLINDLDSLAVLWALDENVPGSILRINLGNKLLLISSG